MFEWNARDVEQFHRKLPSVFYFLFFWWLCLFHHILKSAPKCPFSGSTETVISNCWIQRMIQFYEMNTHSSKQLLWKLLTSFPAKTFPFSLEASGRHLISLLRFLKDRVSKLGNVVQAFTLWNECTRQRTVSCNASFWVLFPDILLFAIVFHVLQNTSFSVLQEQCSNTALWEKRSISLSGMHTSQCCLSESFTPGFIRRYFLFPHRPERISDSPFANPCTMSINPSMTQ